MNESKCFKYLFALLFIILLNTESSYSQNERINLDNCVIPIDFKEVVDGVTIYKRIGTGSLLVASKEYKDRLFILTAKHVVDSINKYFNGIFYSRFGYDSTIRPYKSVRVEFCLCDPNMKILYPDSTKDLIILDFKDASFNLMDSIPNYKLESFRLIGIPYSMIKRKNEIIYPLQTVILAGLPKTREGKTMKGKYKDYIIFRLGIISSIIEDEYSGHYGKLYLVNTETTGGDSGSPVFLFPYGIESSDVKLIGIHTGSYFEGLSIVEPIDEIFDYLNDYLSYYK